MTDVHFYFNVPDKLQLACRLARKAFMQESVMVLTADAAVLTQLDELLWRMAPSDFVAHDCVLQTPVREASPSAMDKGLNGLRLPPSPVQLRERVEADTLAKEGTPPTLLLSLWDEVPAAFSHFERVYELVSSHDEADRQHARVRWKYYQQRGYAIHRHDLTQRNVQ